MKVYKGIILTVNRNDDVARYLVENKGRIVFVGNELPAQYYSAPTVDLGEKALIPPFCDTHSGGTKRIQKPMQRENPHCIRRVAIFGDRASIGEPGRD